MSSRSYERKDTHALRARNLEWARLYTVDLLPQQEIAERYQISRQRVQQVLDSLGVEMRRNAEWVKTEAWKRRRYAGK